MESGFDPSDTVIEVTDNLFIRLRDANKQAGTLILRKKHGKSQCQNASTEMLFFLVFIWMELDVSLNYWKSVDHEMSRTFA